MLHTFVQHSYLESCFNVEIKLFIFVKWSFVYPNSFLLFISLYFIMFWFVICASSNVLLCVVLKDTNIVHTYWKSKRKNWNNCFLHCDYNLLEPAFNQVFIYQLTVCYLWCYFLVTSACICWFSGPVSIMFGT